MKKIVHHTDKFDIKEGPAGKLWLCENGKEDEELYLSSSSHKDAKKPYVSYFGSDGEFKAYYRAKTFTLRNNKKISEINFIFSCSSDADFASSPMDINNWSFHGLHLKDNITKLLDLFKDVDYDWVEYPGDLIEELEKEWSYAFVIEKTLPDSEKTCFQIILTESEDLAKELTEEYQIDFGFNFFD